MLWTDTGIILSTRSFGEHNAIISMLTKEHGRAKGLVRSISGKKNRGIYHIGNEVTCTWNARISEQLGTFSSELSNAHTAHLFHHADKLHALLSACSLCDLTLAEQETHPELYHALCEFIRGLITSAQWKTLYVSFETLLLRTLGFGLDLSRCGSNGSTENLIYISPKTGRAISKEAGAPYHEKLLPLPHFFIHNQAHPTTSTALLAGLKVTGYFLERHCLSPHNRKFPASRTRLMEAISALASQEELP